MPLSKVPEENLHLFKAANTTDVVEMSDPRKTEILPFWIWQEKQEEVYRLLREYKNDNTKLVFFNLPLIDKCLSSCSCVITSRSIEIMPKGIAIAKIKVLRMRHAEFL